MWRSRRAFTPSGGGGRHPTRVRGRDPVRILRIGAGGLDVKVGVFILLLFASLPDCSQNQTAVSDTLRLLSDF